MRIIKIKIAGFKSFVDPTTIELPGNLSAVVGPNGCGKSNIVDAVIWVLGESSAKHLRGDSMADVIFNGSGTRKAVGVASVELIFDNSDGKIGGQYASYGEISIKRQVGRDGLSNYYLNGSRCRRREITQLFLGTGIGSRTYSVIEQGTISRVIEAKPEELRAFLEEAAGISKYKDRRRETESRMHNTRENLARVSDVIGELDKQLHHLERQARAAQRYQTLKQEERSMRAQLLALRWRALKSESDELQKDTAERATAMKVVLAALRACENEIVHERETQVAAAERFNAAQSAFYQAGAELARIEQQIQHGQERHEALTLELAQAERDDEEARSLIDQDQGRLLTLQDDSGQLARLQLEVTDKQRRAQTESASAERAISEWERHWEESNHRLIETQRQEHAAQARIEYLEDSLESAHARLRSIVAEERQLAPETLTAPIETLGRRVAAAHALCVCTSHEHGAAQEAILALREKVHQLAVRLDELRQQRQIALGKIASLEALQQSAERTDGPSVSEWLRQSGVENAERLSSVLRVEKGWEFAVEQACLVPLSALCTDEFDAVARALPSLTAGAVVFTGKRPQRGASGDTTRAPLPPLANKVRGPWPSAHLFAGVYAAETLEEAVAALDHLTARESVITREGVQLGKGWAVKASPRAAGSGQLLRASELRLLATDAASLEAEVSSVSAELAQASAELTTLEQDDGQVRQRLTAAQEALTALRSEEAICQGRLQQARERLDRLAAETADLNAQIEEEEHELKASRARLLTSGEEREELERNREALLVDRDQRRTALSEARAHLQAAHEETHALAMRTGRAAAERSACEQALDRNRAQQKRGEARVADLCRMLADCEAPQRSLHAERETLLGQRLEVENRLAQTREGVQQIDARLRELEQRRLLVEEESHERRDELEKARVAARGHDIRLEALRDQIGGFGCELEQTCAGLPTEATEALWQERLGEIDHKIQRLGPINLAAIDECAALSERKQYLDRQHADLADALSTLEEAMRRIDRETRTRFRETYDRVNTGFQALFPVLFGGGHAYLELVGDDLLETGVTVMARPPGKRNSTIHLLSGGEKALTAVALVFAIFELNPAPFCLLDEVDAPLDDVNVVRLCEMLKERARDIQFVFVTHNKITMEIAEQLIGVTMQEAGVSRLVTVNMEEAVRLAATV